KSEIPHRTKIREYVLGKAKIAVETLRVKLNSPGVPGLISFTFDAWTSEALDPYLAMTAHYIYSSPDEPTKWSLEGNVIGFSLIIGDHSGRNTARIVTRIIDRYVLREKARLIL
ncbi:hypothetical protein M422DRAFT_180009, partial [Sphaerobolus stellatus SS14]